MCFCESKPSLKWHEMLWQWQFYKTNAARISCCRHYFYPYTQHIYDTNTHRYVLIVVVRVNESKIYTVTNNSGNGNNVSEHTSILSDRNKEKKILDILSANNIVLCTDFQFTHTIDSIPSHSDSFIFCVHTGSSIVKAMKK